jgi:3-hydroxyisobutyrate dehydrogenase-like beta-hydroxyacid dehydrogenase
VQISVKLYRKKGLDQMKVAVLGLGLMGSAVAEGMLNVGHEVIVYNRTMSKTEPLVAKGAVAVPAAAEAIRMADAAILVLTDGKAVANLLTEEVLSAVNGKKILNASTTGIDEISDLAQLIKEHGGSLSEISIMVGPEQVKAQEAYFMLGCPENEEAFWNEVLGKDGTVQRVGEVSFATKAETPIVFASVFSSVLMSYVGAAMIKLNIPADIVMQSVGEMLPGVEYMLPNIVKRNYDECMASTESLVGVADAAISTAAQLSMPTKLFEDMRELYVKAVAEGYGVQDASSIVEVLLENK